MRVIMERKQRRHRENIVPMINVVFLLLIFFLLAGTISPRPPFDFNPVTTELRPPSDMPADGLYVSATGTLYFRGQYVGLADLPSAARPSATSSNQTIDVFVDRELTGVALFPVMEALSKAGFAKVRLVTIRSPAS